MSAIKKIFPIGAGLLPLTALAATDILTLLSDFEDILLRVIQVLIILATVIFLWGIIKYVTSGDSEEDKKKARDLIIYGLIGLFVMVTIWGLVQILQDTFDIEESPIPLGPGL